MAHSVQRWTLESRDGVPISLRESGSGDPLVFLHGTGASVNRWQSVSSRLCPEWRVIEYDRRGRGASGDSENYSLDAETEDLAAIILSVGRGHPVDVVAHSFGALISLALASNRPQLFNSLVIYEAPVSIDGSCEFIDLAQVTELERVQRTQGNEAATEFFLRQFPKASEQDITELKQMPSWSERTAAAPTLARELRAAQAFRPDAASFRQAGFPSLILLGELSPDTFHASARSFLDWLPCSILESLPGEAHRGMDNSPDFIADLIRKFLGKVAA